MTRMTVGSILTSLVLSAAMAAAATAADTTQTGWTRSLIVDVTTTQTAYSDSWVGGEAGSFSWVANLNGVAERQLKSWVDFKSTLKLSFGQTLTQDAETKDWSKPQKSTDLIDWENVARFTLEKYIDPYAAFRLESQFLDNSVPEKKRFLTPLRLTESAGMARQFYKKDNNTVVSRLGLALRQIIYQTITDIENLTTGDSTVLDAGLESVTDVTWKFNDRLSYTNKLTLFKAFYNSEEDGSGQNDNWKAVDVNWENIIAAKLSKVITVNLYTQLLYDKEVSLKGRFKETLAIGFVFNLI